MSQQASASSSGRGRGYGITGEPLKRPQSRSDSSRNSSRPGSQAQSPRSSQCSTPDRITGTPKTTVSDSSVGSSMASRLNVTAAEFIPTAARSAKSLPVLSATATEFVPVEYSQPHIQLILYLESVLTEQLISPSRYELAMPHVTTYLKSCLTTYEEMSAACDVIFEWAIVEDNFSYTCARICQHISETVPNNHNGRFHQHMLKRCHAEFGQITNLLSDDPKRACSFVIFLAELYTKEGFRVKHVMRAVLQVVESMINILNDSLARCVGQVMKMCGACLEDDLTKFEGSQDRMELFITAIREKVSSPSVILSRSMSGLLMSVVTLRISNWGRSVSPMLSPAATPSPMADFTQEPVFFNATGQRITREEAGYGEDTPSLEAELGELIEDRSDGQWSTNDGQVWSTHEDTPGAGGDFSEADEDLLNGVVEDLDILVIDDEQMTDDMWAEYERFEAERDKNLREYSE